MFIARCLIVACLVALPSSIELASASTILQPDTAPSPRLPAGLIDLRPKFKPGQTTRLRMTMHSTGNSPNLTGLDIDHLLDEPSTPGKKPPPAPATPTKPNGEPNDPAPQPPLTTRQEFVIVFVVKDAQPNKDSIVEVSFESIKAKSESPEGTNEFDSTKPTPTPGTRQPTFLDDPLVAALKPLVGSKLTLTIDPNGNIKDAKGGQEWSGLGGLFSTGSGPGDLFKGILSPTSAPGLVRVGQSWETRDTIKTGLIGEFKMKTESKLTAHKNNLADVDFKGTIEPGSLGGGGGTDGSFQVKESTYKGRYAWDTERGFLKSMTSEQKIRIDAGMLGTIQHQQTVKLERLQ